MEEEEEEEVELILATGLQRDSNRAKFMWNFYYDRCAVTNTFCQNW
jgi:hypothetical protein